MLWRKQESTETAKQKNDLMNPIIIFSCFLSLVSLQAGAQIGNNGGDAARTILFRIHTKENSYAVYFDRAYKRFPEIPRGLLEAVAFTTTHCFHVTHVSDEPESETGMPNTYGVMGLMLNGQHVFRDNLRAISTLSGYAARDIIASPEINILAFAKAYAAIRKRLKITGPGIEKEIPVLVEISELPVLTGNDRHDYPMNSHLYSVLSILANTENQKEWKLPNYKVDFIKIFGEKKYRILSRSYLTNKQ